MLRLLLFLLLLPSVATAQDCREIRFAKGAYSGSVEGVVGPETDIDCYLIGASAGQTMSVKVVGDNVAFTIIDVMDATAEFQFRTEALTYEVLVFQLFRSIGDRDYRLTVTIR